MHTCREGRLELIQHPPAVCLRIGLRGVLDGVVDDHHVGAESSDTGVDARGQQAALVAVDAPLAHRGLVPRQPISQEFGVLVDDLADLARMGLRELVGVGNDHDLEIGVLPQCPYRRPNGKQA
ncbi:Uncharacterised protein [Mycobacteroides abscessus]|nr:Uncharacterised protein [Mycobacteroides abscessus]